MPHDLLKHRTPTCGPDVRGILDIAPLHGQGSGSRSPGMYRILQRRGISSGSYWHRRSMSPSI
jgi:hypothetical protein